MYAEPAVLTIIDTNIMVPAIYFSTPIAHFLEVGNIVLVWNQFILDEYTDVINRPDIAKMGQKAGVKPREALERLEPFILFGKKFGEMPSSFPPVSRDRKDDPFLFAALQVGAEFIISDDHHMTDLGSYQGIPIGGPGKFFEWVKKTHPMK